MRSVQGVVGGTVAKDPLEYGTLLQPLGLDEKHRFNSSSGQVLLASWRFLGVAWQRQMLLHLQRKCENYWLGKFNN
jgi:hypothetical protein